MAKPQRSTGPVPIDYSKTMFWTNADEARAAAMRIAFDGAVIPAKTKFHTGFALLGVTGKLLGRKAYEKTLPTAPKPKMYFLYLGPTPSSIGRTVSEHATLAEAKSAARRFVASGNRYVDVMKFGDGGTYLIGVMKPGTGKGEGWSEV